MDDDIYDPTDTSASDGPSIESRIAETIGTPIGSLAKVFSADLPVDLWELAAA